MQAAAERIRGQMGYSIHFRESAFFGENGHLLKEEEGYRGIIFGGESLALRKISSTQMEVWRELIKKKRRSSTETSTGLLSRGRKLSAELRT